MSRGRAYNRRISKTKAKRKQKIAENGYFPYYEHLHQYSKNKIHCSCPMCATKTNLKKHGKYRCIGGWNFKTGGKYYTHMDAKRICSMNEDMERYSNYGEVAE